MDLGAEFLKFGFSKTGIIAGHFNERKLEIAGYIVDLLWEHECVVIPGFGGILASYRPASIVPGDHSISPPARSLAFNELLRENDGLLIRHISNGANTDYRTAAFQVEEWVQTTIRLLNSREEIVLHGVGRFFRDVEQHLCFEPDQTVNYLPSAFGLRKIIAAPVLRGEAAGFGAQPGVSLPEGSRHRQLAMVASVLLFIAFGLVSELMYLGRDIQPLNLNAAGILTFMDDNSRDRLILPEPKPCLLKDISALDQIEPIGLKQEENKKRDIPDQVAAPVLSVAAPVVSPAAAAPDILHAPVAGLKYYIIIGAFKKRENFTNAEAYVKARFPDNELYEDTSLEKKRIGIFAADNYQDAVARLNEARKDGQDYWLLARR